MAEEGKFVPIKPRDLSGEEKECVQLIDYNWKENPIVKNKFGEWEEWLAWFWGDQYSYYSKVAGKLIDVSPMVERETKNVYNRIMPMIRQQWGEMRYKRSFYGEPGSPESEDIKAANIASALIQYTNDLRKFNLKANSVDLFCLILGDMFWKEFWNKRLKGFTPGPDGKPVPESGDVDFNWVNPFNVRPDPLAKDRSEWRYFIEGRRLPCSVIEDEFGLTRGTLAGEAVNSDEVDLYGAPDYQNISEPTAVRKEYWAIPSRGYSSGKFAVSACGFLLWFKENPAPDHEIPYFQIPGVLPTIGGQWHDSSVRTAQNPQRQLNKLGSAVDEHIQNFKPKAMIPKNSLDPSERRAFTRAGIDFVIFNPTGAGTPYWQNPPAFPEVAMRWLMFQEKEIETESSVREVSMGRLPKYASRASGVLFESLQGQDLKVLYPAIEDQESVWVEAMKYRLKLFQRHYTRPRLVKILGKSQQSSFAYIEGAEISNNTDIKIRSGVDIFQNREAKREVVMTFLDKGLIKEPRKALELLDVKGLEEHMEDEFVDERHAYRVLEMMKAKDVYVDVSPDDNHDVHFKVFNNFRKTEEFETLHKKRQKNILKRIEDLKGYQGMKEAKPAVEKTSPEAITGGIAPEVAPGMPTMPTPGGVPAPGSPEEQALLAAISQIQGGM